MKVPKPTLAIAWIVIAILFGGVAALQLSSMLSGAYDPVKDDGARAEDVPAHKARLVVIIVAAAASSALAGWYLVRRAKKGPN